nr:MAG TPA: hypothetical protein [Inoviridae sp.]
MFATSKQKNLLAKIDFNDLFFLIVFLSLFFFFHTCI